jgi:hypothetical protein
MSVWLMVMLSGTAQAQDCDAKQLSKDLHEASPVAVARVFVKLAECDPETAEREAAFAMTKTLYGDEGMQAGLAALSVGGQAAVLDWVDGLEDHHRSETVRWLGAQCGEEPKVASFFLTARQAKNDVFLSNRWYAGLGSCRTPEIAAMLTEMIEGDQGARAADRAQYFGLLEVYSRNLGVEAIPTLRDMATSLGDPMEVRLILSAFGDAANVGSGINVEAAKAAIDAIRILGPQIPAGAADSARDILLSLGDEDLANQFAGYRWADRKTDGKYTYYAKAVERFVCKNGKEQAVLHHGMVVEDGTHWPDALQMDLQGFLTEAWELQAAAKCKGEGTITVEMTSEPLAGEAEVEGWLESRVKAFEQGAEDLDKSEVVVQESVAW